MLSAVSLYPELMETFRFKRSCTISTPSCVICPRVLVSEIRGQGILFKLGKPLAERLLFKVPSKAKQGQNSVAQGKGVTVVSFWYIQFPQKSVQSSGTVVSTNFRKHFKIP